MKLKQILKSKGGRIGILIVSIVILSLLKQSNPDLFAVMQSNSYTTSRTCTNFMNGIGNPSMNLPFTWRYTSDQFKCIHSFMNLKKGCAIKYTQDICSENVTISPGKYKQKRVEDSCYNWFMDEINNKNFANFCWKSNTIVSLENKRDTTRTSNQVSCIVTYKPGCTPVDMSTPSCKLVYGSGDSTTRNIFITSNSHLGLLAEFKTITALKTIYPFSGYRDKFNIYRVITNISKPSMLDIRHMCGLYHEGDAIYLADAGIPSGAGSAGRDIIGGRRVGYITVAKDAPANVVAHELIHVGGVGNEPPQMFSENNINNVIRWILMTPCNNSLSYIVCTCKDDELVHTSWIGVTGNFPLFYCVKTAICENNGDCPSQFPLCYAGTGYDGVGICDHKRDDSCYKGGYNGVCNY